MTNLRIPLRARPSQIVTVQLANQNCRIKVYQKRTGLFIDVYVNDAPIVLGIICRDRVWIVRGTTPTFDGDLAFIDTQGAEDPSYLGLDERFQLVWSLP